MDEDGYYTLPDPTRLILDVGQYADDPMYRGARVIIGAPNHPGLNAIAYVNGTPILEMRPPQ